MSLGQKNKFTGIVQRKLVNVGSKSEHAAIVLHTGNGPDLKLRLIGGNAFNEPALEQFVGKRICVEGKPGSGVPQLFIEKVSDITVLGPPARPARPPQP